MNRSEITRALRILIIPGGFVFGLLTTLLLTSDLNNVIEPYARFYPVVIYCLGLMLALRFNKHRQALAILVIAVVERTLYFFGSAPDGTINLEALPVQAAIILFPLNLIVISWITERGFRSWKSVSRVAVLGLEVGVVIYLIRYNPEFINCVADWSVPQINISWPSVPFAASLGFIVAALYLIIAFIRSPTVSEASFFWLLMSAGAGIVIQRPERMSNALLAAGALGVTLAIFELSYRLAYMDELTDLPARRALNEAMNSLGNSYAIAMVDIDHFKKFNDRYGHDIGDQALRLVASGLKGVSGGGKPYRYGGEEFAIIFSGKNLETVLPHLEQLRKSVAAAKFAIRSKKRPRKPPAGKKPGKRRSRRVVITVSIGVAERTDRCAEPQKVIKAADKALYRAKRAGRNRVNK